MLRMSNVPLSVCLSASVTREVKVSKMGHTPQESVGGVLISLSRPSARKSVMHGQCDARLTVTFPATGHHRPVQKLYCLVTKAHHVCEQLAQGCYLKSRGRESNQRLSESQIQRSNHYASRPHNVYRYCVKIIP